MCLKCRLLLPVEGRGQAYVDRNCCYNGIGIDALPAQGRDDKFPGVSWPDRPMGQACQPIAIGRSRQGEVARRITKICDERMVGEQQLHPMALHPFASAVNEPHLGEALLRCCFQVGIDYRQDVSRLEDVQIDHIFDFDNRNVIIIGWVAHGPSLDDAW